MDINKKNIKNEINKTNFKIVLFFSLVILMATSLPLAGLTFNNNREIDINSIGTLRTSEDILWTANGAVICPAQDDQSQPNLISDGEGGTIITWEDDRNSGTTGSDIYAQKINSAGIVQWGINGTLICNEVGDQVNPQIISDGMGGAIITWTDKRVASNQDDLYAQRINSAGAILWDDNGTLISNADTYQNAQQIISDSAGGAIIAWQDSRTYATTFFDIYAQKINSNGITQWDDNGTIICNFLGDQEGPQLVSDGAEGAIITWYDNRNSGTTNRDIYAQKINSAGITQWDDNGTIVCNVNDDQWNPQICSDDAGGAIITWIDVGSFVNDIYAQKINSAGVVQWDDYWTLVCNATGYQSNPQICSDGAGGAIIIWQDERVGTSEDNIYAQKKNTVGISEWDVNGTLICNATNEQWYPQITSDCAGGAIITWRDERNSGTTDRDIYAQGINLEGITKWDDDGILICEALYDQWNPQICSDGAGGAFITWRDERDSSTTDSDIYAQKIFDPVLSIAINSPVNSTIFNSTSGLFNVTVSGVSIHTMWYTINRSQINTIWYSMIGGDTHSFTIITTVDDTDWATLPNNTSLIVTFFVNDSYGNQALSSVQVYVVNTSTGGGSSNIPGFDLVTIGVISVIAIITLAKLHERKKRRLQK